MEDIQKNDSRTSIGLGTEQEEEVVEGGPIDTPFVFKEKLRDTSFYTIRCIHKKILLFWIKDRTALSLPFVDIDWSEKLVNSCNLLQKKIIEYIEGPELNRTERSNDFNNIKPFIEAKRLIGTTHIQLDGNRPKKSISNYVWIAKWMDNDLIKCCQKTEMFEWFSIDDIISNNPNIPVWGPEVKDLIRNLTLTDDKLRKTATDYDDLTERDICRLLEVKPDSDKLMDIQLGQSLHNTGVDRKFMMKLWTHFISHSFPSLFMSEIAFKQYMKRMTDIKDNEIIQRHFRSITTKTFIEFDEFVSDLVARDPKSPDNQWRIGYIFRYYDTNSDKFLDRNDIKELITDITIAKKSTEMNIDEEVDRIMAMFGEEQISFEKFCPKVLSNEIKETSLIYRSQYSKSKFIHEFVLDEKVEQNNSIKSKEQNDSSSDCIKHGSNVFTFCTNTVRMSSIGRISGSKNLRIYRHSLMNEIDFKDENNLLQNRRKYSIELTNNDKSFPNLILREIRDFVKKIQKTKSESQIKELNDRTIEILNSTVVEKVCETVQIMLSNESRVLKLQSPIYVLGDIHGNIKDLIGYEERLWKSAPVVLASNLLFLGDYLNRGKYSIEVVLYLFSLKILCPNQVFLLRGYHELRSVQMNHTFKMECFDKYGQSKGLTVFESFNQCFDCMPFAAVVDELIFCCHGGIPHTISTIKGLMKAKHELKEPEKEYPAVFEILSSEPMEEEDYDRIITELKITNDNGFISREVQNREVGYSFSKKALDYFLKTNNLSHVIRAHESHKRGFELYLDGRVVSIFSSSNYCDFDNNGAVVHINSLDDNKDQEKGVINIIIQK